MSIDQVIHDSNPGAKIFKEGDNYVLQLGKKEHKLNSIDDVHKEMVAEVITKNIKYFQNPIEITGLLSSEEDSIIDLHYHLMYNTVIPDMQLRRYSNF